MVAAGGQEMQCGGVEGGRGHRITLRYYVAPVPWSIGRQGGRVA